MSIVVPRGVIRRVEFRGQEIQAVADTDGRVWVSLRRLCANLSIGGLRDQIEKVRDDETFEDLYKAILMQHSSGAKSTFCIELEALPFWLGSIQVNRIKNQKKRKMIVLYRRECMAVLRDHFFGSPCSCACTCGHTSPTPQEDEEARLEKQLEEVRALKKEEKKKEQDRAAQPAVGGDTLVTREDLAPIYHALRTHNEAIGKQSERLDRFYYDVNGATNYAKEGHERSKEAMTKAEESLAIAHALRDERDNLAYAMKGLPGPGQLSIEILPLRRLRSYVTDLVIAAAHHQGRVKQKVWNDLFSEFLHIHRVDLMRRARNKGVLPVDYAEQFGFIEKLYEVAYVSIALKYHPTINKTSFPLPRA